MINITKEEAIDLIKHHVAYEVVTGVKSILSAHRDETDREAEDTVVSHLGIQEKIDINIVDDQNATRGNPALSTNLIITDEDALFLKITSFSTKHNISISEAVEVLDLQQKLVKGKCQAQALKTLVDISDETNEIKEVAQDIAYQVTELRELRELHEQVGGKQ